MRKILDDKSCFNEKLSSIFIYKAIYLPMLLWILFTPWSGGLDLKVSGFFFEKGSFISHPFWSFIYSYGIWPGWLLTIGALLGLLCSFFSNFRSLRKPCLFLVLTLAIGAGLFVHLIFKENWGRPRPRQVMEFEGTQSFRAYYQPNLVTEKESGKSFTCGHASMGFDFFAVALLGIFYHKRWLYWLGISLAWGLGTLLSIARISQGGHFLSDTLATALIMWLTAWGLFYYLLARGRNSDEGTDDKAT